MTVVPLHSRFERLEAAWRAASADRKWRDMSFSDEILPAIYAAVPDTDIHEIGEMLDWLTRKYTRQTEQLLQEWKR